MASYDDDDSHFNANLASDNMTNTYSYTHNIQVQRVLACNVPGGNRLSCAFRTTSKTTEFFIDESLMPPPIMYLRNRRTHSVFRDPHNDTVHATNPLVTVAPSDNSNTKPFTFGLKSAPANNPLVPDQPRQEPAAAKPRHVKFGPPSGPPTTKASSSTTGADASNTAAASSSAPSTSGSNRVATLQTLVDRYSAPVERRVREEDVEAEDSDVSSIEVTFHR